MPTRRHLLALLSSAVLATALIGCASTPAAPAVEQGVVLKRTYDFKEASKSDMEYALYVPKSYNKRKATPLVILLHGLGSNPQQVINYEGIVAEAEKRGYIVAAPFGYNSGGWYGSRGPGKNMNIPGARAGNTADLPDNLGELSEKDVLNVLDIVRKEFNIDRKRTYLMGHSMGGGGSFYLGMKYPDNWAALAPMAPAIWSDPGEIAKIQKMPIIVVQGDKDTLVNVEGTRRWIAKMQELKMTHKYIEIKDGNHFQTITRNPEMIKEVFDFFDANRKK